VGLEDTIAVFGGNHRRAALWNYLSHLREDHEKDMSRLKEIGERKLEWEKEEEEYLSQVILGRTEDLKMASYWTFGVYDLGK